MLPSQEYRPEPQDGLTEINLVELIEVEQESRPAEGDYEDPHFQVFLRIMEDRDRLLEETPW